MVEKMKFISIVGPKEEIDRVTSQYLSRYEIQLENTLSELKDLKNITPCADSNPYRGVLARAEELAGRVREIGNAAPSGKRMENDLRTTNRKSKGIQRLIAFEYPIIPDVRL